ncbi:MAG TPA: PAS domain S-box protein [Candidatus Acidoferrum sp.]|jgi:two-component system cell cycle sensor histidine kinase/response regulator CckA|nr:PAS domain S-box protein [Candidatus Acidoferrum sp.]
MTKNAPNTMSPDEQAPRYGLRRIERREWWLWGTTVCVTLLLTAAIISFLPPLLHSGETWENLFKLQQAVWGLIGLVLLFDLYSIYQQLQIHRIRRQLLEREQLFRLIGENAADLIAVVDMDGHRIYNSVSYEHALGYTIAELKSSSGFDQIHPDDRAHVQEAGAEARRTGQGKTLEYRMRHKDGSWRVLESTSSVILSPKGVPEKLVIVSRDVTDRKDAIEALRQSEASFRSLVQGAPYGIYRAAIDGKFLRVNPALERMLKYTNRGELIETNLRTGVFRNASDFDRLVELLGSEGEFKDVEVEWKRKDNKSITVRCSGRHLNESLQAASVYEVFAEDVTERRALEKQLSMAAKMEAVGRLSGGIAHDFNNLLGVIIGYSQVLRRKLDPNSPLKEHAEEVEKAAQRAVSLTRQLLAFSRQQILTLAVVDLNTLVSDMQKMLPRLIGEDIAIDIALDQTLGRIKADQGQIEQVVMNLAVNARDAMPNGGKLQIETGNREFDELYCSEHPGAKPGRYVMLAVTDSGAGMTPQTLAHIFEPFFTTKEVGKGTGLGLATVYGIVKQSGGYIWVDSAPGIGSSFQIYLPRVEESVSKVATDAPSDNLRGTETILLVEDADALRKLAQSFLAEHEFNVITASNGEEALRVAELYGHPIDLLVTDVVMPGMNGRALADRLLAKQPKLKVLYISGYTDSFIAGHGVLEAGTFLLHKPFTEEVLIRKVRDVLDGRPSRRDSRVLENDTAELVRQRN